MASRKKEKIDNPVELSNTEKVKDNSTKKIKIYNSGARKFIISSGIIQPSSTAEISIEDYEKIKSYSCITKL